MTNENSNGMVMPVAPMYGGGYGNGFGGFGGDWGWIILLLLCAGGGWGMGGFGGFGGFGNMMLGYDFPWLLTGQQNINTNTNNGFRDSMINDGINSVRDGINGLQTQLCGSTADVTQAINSGFANAETAANSRQMADMQQNFALQSQLANCCCENRLGIANLGSDIAREACATRTNDTQNTQAILNTINGGIQSIKDQLCADKLDAKNDEISALRQQIAMKDLAASQVAQNAFIQQGFSNEVDQLYNRLSNCPVPSTPVYGRTPIFTCNNNNGCGCNSGFYN